MARAPGPPVPVSPLIAPMRRVLPWVVVAGAAVMLLAPLDPALVERWYSGRLYLQLQPRLTDVSNRVPIAVFDLILIAAVAAMVWVCGSVVRGLRRGDRWRAAGTGVVRLLTIGACLYLWFLAVWGLNYRRVPRRRGSSRGATPSCATRFR
jgi:hypothetical protein